MGMFRDAECQEIDLVKEMAEALGSTGLRLDDILEKLQAVRAELEDLFNRRSATCAGQREPADSEINERIRRFNNLVDQAEDTRRWLLIQREAIGFRIHREVERHYPIPSKMKLLSG
ncbi:MAG: hypothetical protein LDL33_05425 [Desulfomonile sp.]|nr:hypothetical protein [Desulfomonile sp.]